MNKALLQQHVNETVRFVGKVIEVRPNNVVMMESSDHGVVTVTLESVSAFLVYFTANWFLASHAFLLAGCTGIFEVHRSHRNGQ